MAVCYETSIVENKTKNLRKDNNCDKTCKICFKKFKFKGSVQVHMKSAHPEELSSVLLECDFCGRRFVQKTSLIQHLQVKHAGGKIDEYQCDLCGKVAKSKGVLYTHITIVHGQLKNCKICNKQVKHLKIHMEIKHSVNQEQFQCKKCKKTFNRKTILEVHLKTHNKQHQCKVCGRRFAIKHKLDKHMKCHDDPSAFQCEKCQKVLKSYDSLWHHRKTHAENREIFKCQHCDYETHYRGNLTKHVLSQHAEGQRERSFKCHKCDHSSFTKGELKRHYYKHDTRVNKRFSCTSCDYSTNLKETLKQHTMTHDKDRVKKFKCEHCCFSTNYKSYLHDHAKRMHSLI